MIKAPFYASRRALALPDRSHPALLRYGLWAAFALFALLLGALVRATPESIQAGPGGMRALGWPLESGFALSTILALIVCFRVWERMFPTEIPSLYTLYPLRSSAVIGRELRGLAYDTVLAATVLIAWQVPSWIILREPQMGYAMFYGLCASLTIAAFAYGVPVLFVRITLGDASQSGGSNAAQVAANAGPAVSFGVTVTVLLLLKLGVEEVAHALETRALLPTLLSNFKAQEAWLTKSAAVALSVPILLAVLAFILGVFLRLRHWLKDSLNISAATAFQPELSYAWIDAQRTQKRPASPSVLLSRRDTVRIQRSAPFRPWLVGIAALLTTLIAFFASPLTRWVVLCIFNASILLWLQIPAKVSLAWPQRLREWDLLMVSARNVRTSHVLTMTRIAGMYGVFLLAPALAYSLVSTDWLPLVFSALCCVALAAHATYLLQRPIDV